MILFPQNKIILQNYVKCSIFKTLFRWLLHVGYMFYLKFKGFALSNISMIKQTVIVIKFFNEGETLHQGGGGLGVNEQIFKKFVMNILQEEPNMTMLKNFISVDSVAMVTNFHDKNRYIFKIFISLN